MYDFYTIILYGIMLNLCQSWLLKLDIACHCSLFGSFGKYRNRTESTDTEFLRYRVSAGTDRYRLTEEQNLYGYRRTEPIDSVLPNAQGDLRFVGVWEAVRGGRGTPAVEALQEERVRGGGGTPARSKREASSASTEQRGNHGSLLSKRLLSHVHADKRYDEMFYERVKTQ